MIVQPTIAEMIEDLYYEDLRKWKKKIVSHPEEAVILISLHNMEQNSKLSDAEILDKWNKTYHYAPK